MWEIIIVSLLQITIVLFMSLFLEGVRRKLIARLHSRIGPPISQPFRDLVKLWRKREEIKPECSSWIFEKAPIIALAVLLTLSIMIPIISSIGFSLRDIILIIYSLIIFRFILSLAAFDASSPYGIPSAWRETYLGILGEVALILPVLCLVVTTGTTDLGKISYYVESNLQLLSYPSFYLAAIAGFIALLLETGVQPFDVAEAEQELQEGISVEYSGKTLALFKLDQMLKRVVIPSLFLSLFVPWGISSTFSLAGLLVGTLSFMAKIFIIHMIFLTLSVSNARIRFVEMPQYFEVSIFLSIIALVLAIWRL
ncbi:respiratory chain complex I subunit 1 family protein [Fervidicoccus fontis]|uniref:Component HyfC of membrane-bound [Ni,Fe]-hydrogenase n=2 Tax=Fervidicoccus fontis TaxID=683846 RepID=I0A2S0_FERFK|nr:NADH-quinone oxidoreductase subunit H [Fervidicoccus fontis]AFH43277.1 Component HyfC of membrane-bound [Ni,Fe]-hydrogenase [Fervidicoccus fontis Kam940]PMB76527.1 MAG: NADH-quinone oxidoreductase subunit NuoH [Fervidicoccus fontis]